MKPKGLPFVCALALVAAALRFLRLGAQSLWVDEILTLSVSVPNPGLTIWDYLKYNIHGPLHSFVVYIFHFASMSDAWLRLPSAFAGVLAVVFFYLWIREWLGERTARVSSVLLAIHPLHIYYSQEVRNYSFLFFFAIFSSYVFHRILREEKRRYFLAYVVGIVCAALSNFTAAFLFAVHSILYLVRRGGARRRILRWAVVSLVVLVMISPWVYRIYAFIDVKKLVTPVMPGEISTEERLRGETTVGGEALPYLLYVFSAGFSWGPSTRELHFDTSITHVVRNHWMSIAWVALLFGSLSVAGAISLGRRGAPRAQIVLYFLVPIVLTLLLCWQNAKAFNVRYVLLSFPVYICVIASGILAFRRPVCAFAGIAAGATLLLSLGNYYFVGKYARDDVRSAVRIIEKNAQPSDCILTHTVTEVVQHYQRKQNALYSVYAPAGSPPEQMDRQLSGLIADCERVWYVRAREWVDDPRGRLMKVLDARFTRTESYRFDGVTVYRYERGASEPSARDVPK